MMGIGLEWHFLALAYIDMDIHEGLSRGTSRAVPFGMMEYY